jgi:hypothetical protein
MGFFLRGLRRVRNRTFPPSLPPRGFSFPPGNTRWYNLYQPMTEAITETVIFGLHTERHA